MLYLVPVQPRHARMIAAHLRDQDRAEIQSLHNLSTHDALLVSIVHSDESFTIMSDGVPVGLCGHRDVGGGGGLVWMVGTPALTAHRREFLDGTDEVLPQLISGYEWVTNIVTEQNTLHMRWLEWLGAEFTEPFAAGPQRVPCRSFYLDVRCYLSRLGDRQRGRNHHRLRSAIVPGPRGCPDTESPLPLHR